MGFFDVIKSFGLLNPIGAVSALTTFGGDMFLQKEQNDANKKLYKDQQRFAVDMWNMQNAYNTPSAQMQRLRDAGLNPNLAYGQVSDSKAAQVATPSAPTMGRVQMPRLAEYQQVVNLQEQNALIRAQKDEVEQRALSSALDNEYKNYENKKLINSGMLKSDQGSLGGLFRYIFRNSSDRLKDTEFRMVPAPDFYKKGR